MVDVPRTRYARSDDFHIAYRVMGRGIPGEWRLFVVAPD
jgi:hypothetical protein